MPNKFDLPKPINEIQRRFADLCEKGGGAKGGPARPRVQKLLRAGGRLLNEIAYKEIREALAANSDADPWKVCFAVALCWGHLAQLKPEFISAAVRCLAHWNDPDLRVAMCYPLERGPGVIEASLRGGYVMFSRVVLPPVLPTTLAGLRRAQDRWLSHVIGSDRPAYIGSWNSCAIFMVALFSNPTLAAELLDASIGLPPGGPIYSALSILHRLGVLPRAPAGNSLDESSFEPGAIYENTGLMADLLKGLPDWSMVDVHSGLYLLGTRENASDDWIDWTKADWT